MNEKSTPCDALAQRGGDAHELAAAEEVRFGDRHFADEAVRRRVAARDARTGPWADLRRRRHDHDAVGRGARLVRDANALEEAEVVEAAFGPVDEDVIVGVAFAQVELAADDVVARAGVAANVDALDVDARAFLDDEGRGRSSAWPDRGRRAGEPARRRSPCARSRVVMASTRLLDVLGVVDVARLQADGRLKRRGIDIRDARIDGDGADAVLRAPSSIEIVTTQP